jgi:hypothetical protein
MRYCQETVWPTMSSHLTRVMPLVANDDLPWRIEIASTQTSRIMRGMFRINRSFHALKTRLKVLHLVASYLSAGVMTVIGRWT